MLDSVEEDACRMKQDNRKQPIQCSENPDSMRSLNDFGTVLCDFLRDRWVGVDTFIHYSNKKVKTLLYGFRILHVQFKQKQENFVVWI